MYVCTIHDTDYNSPRIGNMDTKIASFESSGSGEYSHKLLSTFDCGSRAYMYYNMLYYAVVQANKYGDMQSSRPEEW